MKDEEMAEEYKESKRHKCFRADVGKIQIEYEMYLNNLKQAFLAGLKAGKPQWHDLRKDPNDLPKGQINRYLFGYVKNYRGKKPMLISYNGEWFYDANTYNTEVKVIAWCEIPTFDKE